MSWTEFRDQRFLVLTPCLLPHCTTLQGGWRACVFCVFVCVSFCDFGCRYFLVHLFVSLSSRSSAFFSPLCCASALWGRDRIVVNGYNSDDMVA